MPRTFAVDRSLIALCCVTAIATIVGCGGRGGVSGTYPVAGKVTYKGAPVGGATVTFLNAGGGENSRAAVAISGSDGSYELMTLESKGALPGKYKVLVTKTDTPAELTKEVSMEDAAKINTAALPVPKELLPVKYGTPSSSPLEFDVKAESNTINLELVD